MAKKLSKVEKAQDADEKELMGKSHEFYDSLKEMLPMLKNEAMEIKDDKDRVMALHYLDTLTNSVNGFLKPLYRDVLIYKALGDIMCKHIDMYFDKLKDFEL